MPEHWDVTERIIGCCFNVINELGPGFLESVYEKSLLVALHDAHLKAESQVPVGVVFRGQCVGEFFADIMVEGTVIVELKAVKALTTEHKSQLINYLTATKTPVGLLVNFGGTVLEYRRLTPRERPKENPHADRQEGVEHLEG